MPKPDEQTKERMRELLAEASDAEWLSLIRWAAPRIISDGEKKFLVELLSDRAHVIAKTNDGDVANFACRFTDLMQEVGVKMVVAW